MIAKTVSREQAQRFYDRLGRHHDWAEHYEGRAKARALELLMLRPGLRLLNAGVGTGRDHASISAAVGRTACCIGLDISPVMLGLVRRRTGSPVVRADVCRLPFTTGSMDRIFCAYVLDLIATIDLPQVVNEFHRVLKPDGRMVVVSLTGGVSPVSRVMIRGWNFLYRVDPVILGGCRPLRLIPLLELGSFAVEHDEVLEQVGVPSEVVAAMPLSSASSPPPSA